MRVAAVATTPAGADPAKKVSQHLPPFAVAALLRAAAARDIQDIDRITDLLARDGLCRRRGDTSLLGQLRERARSS